MSPKTLIGEIKGLSLERFYELFGGEDEARKWMEQENVEVEKHFRGGKAIQYLNNKLLENYKIQHPEIADKIVAITGQAAIIT